MFEFRPCLAAFLGFMVLGWTAKASEILIECNVDRVEKYSREYVYRIDDKYFGLRQSFKSLSSDGKTFENFCSEQHIDHLFAGVKLDLRKIKWTRNFQTTFYETGARCTFLAGVQHKYFFVSEIYVDVNAAERQRSFRSSPIEYEEGTPPGEQVYPFGRYGACEILYWSP